jgi:putative hydrolase of the HAD superfamily
MNKIKAIIFDADGMLIPNKRIFSIRYQEKYGITNNEMLSFFEGPFLKCEIGKADLKEEIKPFLEKWKWDKGVDELLKFWFEAEKKLDDRIVKLIENLKNKNINCYLMTNNEKYRTEYLKKEVGLDNIFNKVFSSAYIGCMKPEKECFDYLYREVKIDKEEILFCDDNKDNIEGASSFGFETYLYKSYNEFVELLNNKYKLNL